jgi:sugar phosphate isomerase/epimerase
MRFAVSNIAWTPRERASAYAVLNEHGVRGLEIAPALAFPDEPDAFAPSDAAVAAFLGALDEHSLQPVSMQSLLFGTADAYLFGSPAQRERFEAGLARAIGLAGRLGIPNLVMGSPANRSIPADMTRADAERIAVDTFRRCGDLCLKANARLAIEPNPTIYGTNFLTTIHEAIEFVNAIEHPGVSLNFDIGSLHVNGEIAEGGEWFAKAKALASHVHVSEPQLAPAPKDAKQFETLARQILGYGYSGWFSLEMRAMGEDNIANLKAAITACTLALTAAKQDV